MYQNYYFYITFYLVIPDGMYFMGNQNRHFKKKFWFNDSLNGNELINYIKWEIDRLGISFMFTKSTICFTINVKIYRSYEYMHRYLIESRSNLNPNLNPKPIKKIIKAEKSFKEDVCAICITNPANILFCNCGHLCVCEECAKTGEGFEKCPICKTKNTNLRVIE